MEWRVTMADIESMAVKWAANYAKENDFPEAHYSWRDDLATAYLAGVAQAQNDYQSVT